HEIAVLHRGRTLPVAVAVSVIGDAGFGADASTGDRGHVGARAQPRRKLFDVRGGFEFVDRNCIHESHFSNTESHTLYSGFVVPRMAGFSTSRHPHRLAKLTSAP